MFKTLYCLYKSCFLVANYIYKLFLLGGNVPRFPDPRDFRLAIVDEPNGIRLKVDFLSPALSNITIDVRILVAIGINAWPSSTDFPSRISLGHSDCLLYHQAAQTVGDHKTCYSIYSFHSFSLFYWVVA